MTNLESIQKDPSRENLLAHMARVEGLLIYSLITQPENMKNIEEVLTSDQPLGERLADLCVMCIPGCDEYLDMPVSITETQKG